MIIDFCQMRTTLTCSCLFTIKFWTQCSLLAKKWISMLFKVNFIYKTKKSIDLKKRIYPVLCFIVKVMKRTDDGDVSMFT
jgi:hypothetical protein